MSNITENKPPVVVVLGHVDHGKSSLLEAVKDLKITEKESGGITQHIGAYFIEHQGKGITFIDTPGHEAFSAMRSRGARVADIGVLVVAADEGVKEQTKEAIKHLNNANMPFVVVVNKIDKKDSDPEKAKLSLSMEGVFVESMGGSVPSVNISAKTKEGIEDLLEMITIMAEMEDLKCDRSSSAKGVVIETKTDKGRGVSVIMIIKDGTLKKGDTIGMASSFGKIRTMEDCTGKSISEAGPSRPVCIIGIKGDVHVGDEFNVYKSADEAKKAMYTNTKTESAESVVEVEEFPIIIKADTTGSLEAIENSINSLSRENILVKIISSGIGDINESDVTLAKTAKAELFSFHVKADSAAKKMIIRDGIKVRSSEIIYELIENIKEEASKRISPQTVRTEIGKVRVLAVFRTKGNRQIIGGKVIKGEIVKGSFIEVRKGEEKKGEGKIINLKKEEKNIEKAPEREEVGMLFEGTGKVEEGDHLIIFKEEEVTASL